MGNAPEDRIIGQTAGQSLVRPSDIRSVAVRFTSMLRQKRSSDKRESRRAVARMAALPADDVPGELARLYLDLEAEEAKSGVPARPLQDEALGLIRAEFPDLLQDIRIALLFSRPRPRERMMCQIFLAEALKNASRILAPDDSLQPYIAWVSAIPNAQAPVPFDLRPTLPTRNSEWITLLYRLSRELYSCYRERLAEGPLCDCYEKAYDDLAEQYGKLDAFSFVVNLLPPPLLDSKRLNKLSRSGLQEILMRNLENAEVVNQELTEQNAALEIVRRDLELARTELEKRVAERTETLQLVNEQLSSAKDRAEHADGAKSEFLANMSHELRTPLNAIMGFSETIKEALFGPVDQRYREYASDIHRSGAHLLDVINDILDLSKLEAGKFELREERTSVDALISESMEMLEFRARNGGVALESAIAAQLPPLYADPLRMRQILINLLSNAVKFTLEGGKVTISARRHGDGGLLFEVSDTGIGMKPDDVSRALEPFRQIDSQLNRKHEGTGLGLPLVTRLAELHGGTFAIVSALGIGTTATVYMPPSRLVEPERSLAAG